jgi:hypothetical protein
MKIDEEKCNGCELCIDACCLGSISSVDGQITISEDCVNSKGCPAQDICPQNAIAIEEKPLLPGAVKCTYCMLGCAIKPGKTGDCQKFTNRDGIIVRSINLTPFEEVKEIVGKEYDPVICKPLITGIGAGNNRNTAPNQRAPYMVQDKVQGIDVVTAVSEAQFYFSGIEVKIDSGKYVGEEGSEIFHKGIKVGRVATEEYGSHLMYIGGINTFIGKHRWRAAKLVADIANRERVELQVKNGSKLEIQVGEKPTINGVLDERRPIGCGVSGATSLETEYLPDLIKRGIVNEGIVIHRQSAGHFGTRKIQDPKSYWERETKSGIKLRYESKFSRCSFPEGGNGWGMTPLEDPLDIIESFDPDKLGYGFTLLITDVTGDRCEFYQLNKKKKFEKIEIPPEVERAMEEYRANCEPARVSAYYRAGAGGGARRTIVKRPIKLSEAFRDKKAFLTVGGAPAEVLVGGGIDLRVNVERVKRGSFFWTARPATVAPIEYTMKLKDFIKIGGHTDTIRPLKEVLEEIKAR